LRGDGDHFTIAFKNIVNAQVKNHHRVLVTSLASPIFLMVLTVKLPTWKIVFDYSVNIHVQK